ncbi:MAG TPA: hypothetical protein VFG07_06720 [Thermoplasmata archaeon]|nr:hypothetical protein [Thermoplasmata archaeon]
MVRQEIPIGACLLTVLGGAFILLEGAAELVGAVAFGPSLTTGVGIDLAGIGGLNAFEGLLLILLAFALLFNPRNHTGIGIGVLTFAMLSLLTGGGFYLGALLAYFGGVLGILFAYRPVASPNVALERIEEFDDPVAEADLIDSGALPVPKEPPQPPSAPPSPPALD